MKHIKNNRSFIFIQCIICFLIFFIGFEIFNLKNNIIGYVILGIVCGVVSNLLYNKFSK